MPNTIGRFCYSHIERSVVVVVAISIEIKGEIDSKALWSLIERYGVNLTDLGKMSLVYGSVKDFHDATDVIVYCALFGDITSKVDFIP